MTTKSDKFDFNQGLKQLEEIVNKMEVGEMSLADSLNFFEQGINLSKQCQESLTQAQQKILKLTQENGYTNPSVVDNDELI
jgi:exodeoxyribonuclease VII small subunit